MALEKIRPRVVDPTGNYTFNDVTLTGNLSAPTANISNLTVTNLVTASTTITLTGNLSTTANIIAGNIKTDHLLYANGDPWAMGTSTTVSGSNTQVQFNDSSSFGASANFTFNKNTNTLTVTNISGNGASLTSLTGSNVIGTVANATYAVSAGSATSATTAGTVTTAAQPNITSVGTLTSLGVTGNLTSGNANLGNLTISNYFVGNGSLLTSILGGNVTGNVGNALYAYAVAGANVSGAVTYAGTANAVAGANVMGAVGLATYATTANVVAGSNVSGQVGNATVAGTVYTASQPNITSVGTLTNTTLGSSNSLSGGNLVSATYLTGTLTTASQPNITSVGTLSSLVVTANANVGNINSGGVANITGNLTSLNANLGNLAIANYITGTLTTASQPNITNLGTLSSLTVTANITTGNLLFGSGIVTGTGNIISGNANLGNLTTTNNLSVTSYVTSNLIPNANVTYSLGTTSNRWKDLWLSGSTIYLADGTVSAGTVALGNSNISIPIANGNVTISAIGNANIVVVTGTGVNVAGTLNITSNANVGNLGFGSGIITGIGNIITGNANLGNLAIANYFSGNGSLLTSITGANVTGFVPNANIANTAYAVAGSNVSGAVSYATTANSVAGANVSGAVSYATTANSVAGANVSGAVAYATTANTVAGANVSGYVPNANIANTAYSVSASNISGIINLANYATTANAVAGSNVSGQVGNALIAGAVYTNAQPNITSLGTLTSLTVSGDTTLTGNLIVSGAFEYANVTTFRVKDPIIEQGGNTAGGALTSNDGYDRGQLLHYYTGTTATDAFMGWKNTSAEFIFASNAAESTGVVTVTSYGNVRANVYFGNGSQLTGVSAVSAGYIANGTSNVNIPTVNGNITVGVAGNAGIVTVTGTGVNIAGYANLGSGNLLTTGNITAGYFIGNGSQLTGIAKATSADSVANGTSNVNIPIVNGNVNLTAAGNTSLVVTGTGANITGTLNATGNISFTGANVSLGAVGNLKITGGTSGQYLKTDGAGNLSWSSVTAAGGGASVTVSSTAPATPSQGDLWLDAESGDLNVYFGGAWGDVSPSASQLDIQVNNFTGDGIQTSFTLTVTPAGTNYTLVMIGGIVQPRNYYTITGATISFGTAPPANTSVEVSIFGGGASAIGLAGSVTNGAQPNITSTGTLTGLTVAGNVGVTGNVAITGNLTINNASPASTGKAIAMAIVFGF
jgi:hypothetical protein